MTFLGRAVVAAAAVAAYAWFEAGWLRPAARGAPGLPAALTGSDRHLGLHLCPRGGTAPGAAARGRLRRPARAMATCLAPPGEGRRCDSSTGRSSCLEPRSRHPRPAPRAAELDGWEGRCCSRRGLTLRSAACVQVVGVTGDLPAAPRPVPAPVGAAADPACHFPRRAPPSADVPPDPAGHLHAGQICRPRRPGDARTRGPLRAGSTTRRAVHARPASARRSSPSAFRASGGDISSARRPGPRGGSGCIAPPAGHWHLAARASGRAERGRGGAAAMPLRLLASAYRGGGVSCRATTACGPGSGGASKERVRDAEAESRARGRLVDETAATRRWHPASGSASCLRPGPADASGGLREHRRPHDTRGAGVARPRRRPDAVGRGAPARLTLAPAVRGRCLVTCTARRSGSPRDFPSAGGECQVGRARAGGFPTRSPEPAADPCTVPPVP
jgi:hypothetical protein